MSDVTVKAVFLKHVSHPIAGFCKETLRGWIIEAPVYVVMGKNDVTLVPFMGMFEEDKITFKEDELLFTDAPFNVTPQVESLYRNMMGQKSDLILPPEPSIIV